MSPELELQKYLYDAITGDAAVMAEINAVYDRVPKDPFGSKDMYVSFGPHSLVEDDSECITSDQHTFQIDVWSRKVGMVELKTAAHLIRRLLHNRNVPMIDNGLALMSVSGVQYMRDPDGLTNHGVITVVAMIEEPVT